MSSKRVRKPTEKLTQLQQERDDDVQQHHVPKKRNVGSSQVRLSSVAISDKIQVERKTQIVDWHPPSVTLSMRDKAPQLILSEDHMICKGAVGGYRMVRATHGVHNGAYYWECEVLTPPVTENREDAHIRIGWSTRQGELQAPVGYDKFSYAYRDIAGSKVHESIRDDTYGEAFGPGDIIGCYIFLDEHDPSSNQMRFFKNGKDQGIAYRGADMPPGVYFPAISLYMKAEVQVNFGPSFILRHNIYDAIAVSEVQPMSPEDRKIHEQRIAAIRESRGLNAATTTTSSNNQLSSSTIHGAATASAT